MDYSPEKSDTDTDLNTEPPLKKMKENSLPSTNQIFAENGRYFDFPKRFKSWFQSAIDIKSQNKKKQRHLNWNVSRSTIDQMRTEEIHKLTIADFKMLFTRHTFQFRCSDEHFSDHKLLLQTYLKHSKSTATITSFPFNTTINYFVRHHPWLMAQSYGCCTWLNFENSSILCTTAWGSRKSRLRPTQKKRDVQILQDSTMERVKQLLALPKIQGLIVPICLNKGDTAPLEDYSYGFYCIHFIRNHACNPIKYSNKNKSRNDPHYSRINVYLLSMRNPAPEVEDNDNGSNFSAEVSDAEIMAGVNITSANTNIRAFLHVLTNNTVADEYIDILDHSEYELNLRMSTLQSETIIDISPVDTAFILCRILTFFDKFVYDMDGFQENEDDPITAENNWNRVDIPIIYYQDVLLFRIQILHALNVRSKIINLVEHSERCMISMRHNHERKSTCHMCRKQILRRKVNQQCNYTQEQHSTKCSTLFCDDCMFNLIEIYRNLLLKPKKEIQVHCYEHSSYKQKIVLYGYICWRAAQYKHKLHEIWLNRNPTLANYFDIRYLLYLRHFQYPSNFCYHSDYSSDVQYHKLVSKTIPSEAIKQESQSQNATDINADNANKIVPNPKSYHKTILSETIKPETDVNADNIDHNKNKNQIKTDISKINFVQLIQNKEKEPSETSEPQVVDDETVLEQQTMQEFQTQISSESANHLSQFKNKLILSSPRTISATQSQIITAEHKNTPEPLPRPFTLESQSDNPTTVEIQQAETSAQNVRINEIKPASQSQTQ
ncbi:MAG: hypothetical protein GY928_28880 [Colwellia sp.]|nr:hypothetical protein [Colwellia sp.]